MKNINVNISFIFILVIVLLSSSYLYSATYGLGGAMEEPTLSLSDASTGSTSYSNSKTVNVSIGNDTGATYWLLSESQSTQPSSGSFSVSTKPTSSILSADGAKTLYIWIKDGSGNINTGPVSDSITVDTTAPAGTMSISFSGITTSGITITGAALTDATQGDEYYEFDCTTSDTFDKSRTKDTRSYALTGMSPNTQYTFKYRASDGVKEVYGESASNFTSWSSAYSKYTLASAPSSLSLTTASSTSISCSWSGDATQYQIEYANNSSFTNSTTSSWQTAKTYTMSSLSSGITYYARVKGKNGDGTETGYSSTASATTSLPSVTTSTTTAPAEEAATPIVTSTPAPEPSFVEAEQPEVEQQLAEEAEPSSEEAAEEEAAEEAAEEIEEEEPETEKTPEEETAKKEEIQPPEQPQQKEIAQGEQKTTGQDKSVKQPQLPSTPTEAKGMVQQQQQQGPAASTGLIQLQDRQKDITLDAENYVTTITILEGKVFISQVGKLAAGKLVVRNHVYREGEVYSIGEDTIERSHMEFYPILNTFKEHEDKQTIERVKIENERIQKLKGAAKVKAIIKRTASQNIPISIAVIIIIGLCVIFVVFYIFYMFTKK